MQLVILKKRAEFQRVRGGIKWTGRGFLAEGRARPSVESISGVRFGFTISKKVGKAVERNRIRRRLKEALRRIDFDGSQPEIDIVIVARRAALDMPFDALTNDLSAALAKLLKPRNENAARRNADKGAEK